MKCYWNNRPIDVMVGSGICMTIVTLFALAAFIDWMSNPVWTDALFMATSLFFVIIIYRYIWRCGKIKISSVVYDVKSHPYRFYFMVLSTAYIVFMMCALAILRF